MKTDEASARQKKERWAFGMAVLLLLTLCYFLWQSTKPPGPLPSVSFDPTTGTVVNDSLGNGDGRLQAGERASLTFSLTNNSDTETTPGFDLVLSTPLRDITIHKDRLHFEPIKPGETQMSMGEFEFTLDSTFNSSCAVFKGKRASIATAGFIPEALADTDIQGSETDSQGDEILFTVDVHSGVEITFISCTLEQAANNTAYLVSSGIGLCNAGGVPFTRPKLKIESVRAYLSPEAQFIPDVNKTVPLDSLLYNDDLALGECVELEGLPDGFIDKVRFLSSDPLEISGETINMEFTITVYKGTLLWVIERRIIAATVVNSGTVIN